MTLKELRDHHAQCLQAHRQAQRSFENPSAADLDRYSSDMLLALAFSRRRDADFHGDCLSALDAAIARPTASGAVDLTADQIAAGAAVIGDDGKPIGRNTAIMVADAMRRAVNGAVAQKDGAA